MKNLFTLLILFVSSLTASAQTTVTVYKQVAYTPGPSDSSCQYIFKTTNCQSGAPFANAENSVATVYDEISAGAWSYNSAGCNFGYIRSFIKFPDMDTLKATSANIDSVQLYLYGLDMPNTSMPQGNSGSNESWISRLKQSWNRNTLTWNTQPTDTPAKRVAVPASTQKANYDVQLDVTGMVKDMYDQQEFHGFKLQLDVEILYRAIGFFSNFVEDANKRPTLKVYYHYDSTITQDTSTAISLINELEQSLNVYPNPAKDVVYLEFSNSKTSELSYDVRDVSGKVLYQNTQFVNSGHNKVPVDVSAFSKGIYIITLHDGANVLYKRFTKL